MLVVIIFMAVAMFFVPVLVVAYLFDQGKGGIAFSVAFATLFLNIPLWVLIGQLQ